MIIFIDFLFHASSPLLTRRAARCHDSRRPSYCLLMLLFADEAERRALLRH